MGSENKDLDGVEGQNGELIARFMELVGGTSEAVPRRWANWGFYVSYWLGGLYDVDWRRGDELDRTEVVDAVRARIGRLIRDGVQELFLVPALVNALEQELIHFADVGGAASRRGEARRHFEEALDDPQARKETLERLRKDDPTATDADAVNVLRSLIEKMSDPTAEEATSKWAELEEFRAESEALLSPAVIKLWRLKNGALRIQQQSDDEGPT